MKLYRLLPVKTRVRLLAASCMLTAMVLAQVPAAHAAEDAGPAPSLAPISAPTDTASASANATANPASATDIEALSLALKPTLPLDYADFATDFKPKELRPSWLTFQIGTVEIFQPPPEGKSTFMLTKLPAAVDAEFHPIEISCIIGAKSRYANVTEITIDPLGRPLGYALPLGQLVYFLAREETLQGVSFSVHYYEASQLQWLPHAGSKNFYVPKTACTMLTQNLLAPVESYVFIYLSSRMPPSLADSPVQPKPLYSYLLMRIHRAETPAPPTGLAPAIGQ